MLNTQMMKRLEMLEAKYNDTVKADNK